MSKIKLTTQTTPTTPATGKVEVYVDSTTKKIATKDDAGTIVNYNTGLTVADGGTGVTTLGDAGILIGNGTGAIQVTSAGTVGQILTSNGSGVDPTFETAAGGGDMYLANIQTVTGAKTFGSTGAVGKLKVAGTTSGSTIIDATAIAGSGTVTLPTTGTLSTLDGTETLTNKTLTSPTLTTPVLGTPSSGTLTNATGLPVAGIAASTSTALGVGSVEVGHATDSTLSRSAAGILAVEGDPIVTRAQNNTFTKSQRGSITALTDGANIATDLALNNFFSVTLAGNRTLDNPTNVVAGQSGCIFITQDGTGSRTLAYGTDWDFAGGTPPVLSTAANSVDRLDYIVRTATSIHAVLTKGWS